MQKHFHEHTYPSFLLRRPQWVRLVHAWNWLFLQRNRLVIKTLRHLLPALPPGSLMLDAGCGSGQHLFAAGRRRTPLRYWGLDKQAENIDFCKKYAGTLPEGALRFHFFQQNLEEMAFEEEASLILCAGVLQYIGNDLGVLCHYYKALKPGGLLLLYVPVNGVTVLPIYRHFFNRLNHYEKSRQRQRIYTPAEISEKLSLAGFDITSRRFTYGTTGIVGHELYSLFVMALGNPFSLAAWLLPLWAALLPLALLLISVDYHFSGKKSGNGLLLIAKKTA